MPERGISTLEYTGIVALAVILVTALVLGVTQWRFGERLSHALCELTSLGQGDCGNVVADDGRAPEDYVPPEQCVVSSEGQSTEGNLTVVVTLEGGETWEIQQMGDGTYRLSKLVSGSLGIGVGVGVDFSVVRDGETFGVGAYANANAALGLGEGEVFIAESAEHARDILSAQRSDHVKDSYFGDGWWRDRADDVHSFFGGDLTYEQLAPTEWFVEGGLELDASAGATALTGSVDASAAVNAYLGRRERSDGTTTDFLRADASIDGGVAGWGPNAQGYDVYVDYSATGSMAAVVGVDKDSQGNVVGLTLTSTVMGNLTGDRSYHGAGGIDDPDEYIERTMHIPITHETDRALASRVLHSVGIPYYPGVTEGFDPGQAVTDRTNPRGLAEDLHQAVDAGGWFSEEVFTVDTTENGFNLAGKYGVELGLGGSSVESTRATTRSQYWDGTTMVDRLGCVA